MKKNNIPRALATLILGGAFIVFLVGAASNPKERTGDGKPLVFTGVGTGSTDYFEIKKGAKLHWQVDRAEPTESMQVDVLDLHDKPLSSPVLAQGQGRGAEDFPEGSKIVRLNITANQGVQWHLSTSEKGLGSKGSQAKGAESTAKKVDTGEETGKGQVCP